MSKTIPLLGLFLILNADLVQASQVENLYPTIIGDRAFGFAGAFTALSDDATAGWYNPAGLGYLEKTYINATGNIYGYHETTVKEAIIIKPASGGGISKDFETVETRATPSTASLARKLGPGTFGFGIYVPRQMNTASDLNAGLDYYDTIYSASLRNEILISNDYFSSSLYLGPSYGMKIARDMALGASAFITYMENVSNTMVQTAFFDQAGNNLISGIGWNRTETEFLGMRFALGGKARWNDFHFGANLLFPTIRISEKTKQTDAVMTGGPSSATSQTESFERDTSNAGRGWNIAAGLAWSRAKRWALEIDGTYYVPTFDSDISNSNVLNLKLGGELSITENILIRAGLFTDRSTSDDPIQNRPDVDIYGGTAQVTYQSEIPGTHVLRSMSVGIGYAKGDGKGSGILITDGLVNTIGQRDVEVECITVMIGGSLRF
jgi:hypothetical protein